MYRTVCLGRCKRKRMSVNRTVPIVKRNNVLYRIGTVRVYSRDIYSIVYRTAEVGRSHSTYQIDNTGMKRDDEVIEP